MPFDGCDKAATLRYPLELIGIQCVGTDCSGYGSCDLGICSCDRLWVSTPVCDLFE